MYDTIVFECHEHHGKSIFSSQILFPMSNCLTIRLVGCWLMLAMQRWFSNLVYSSATLTLATPFGTSVIL